MAKQRTFSVNGKTNDLGQLMISDKQSMDEFFKQWPNCRFVGKFSVAQPGTSELLRDYYYYKVVPDVRKGFIDKGTIRTEQETEEYLRSVCPIMIEEFPDTETGEYSYRIRGIRELDNSELIFFIDFIKQFAAEELSIFVEDPRVLNQ